jgi:hypothetical protein
MLQGIPPYRLACNMKLPGTYAAYAALMAVFGQSIAGAARRWILTLERRAAVSGMLTTLTWF